MSIQLIEIYNRNYNIKRNTRQLGCQICAPLSFLLKIFSDTSKNTPKICILKIKSCLNLQRSLKHGDDIYYFLKLEDTLGPFTL